MEMIFSFVTLVLFLDHIAGVAAATAITLHEDFQWIFFILLLVRNAVFTFGGSADIVNQQEGFMRDKFLLLSLHQFTIEHLIRQYAAVEWIGEYSAELLLVHLQPHRL
ncbi:hypothetical protein [Pseudoflavitalea rhizosphaerae]|uniref:hypothetical protein n=1 Tax=Pseudoflavitalea rhizosphaerae TaxID=1884793 RepID=UPI000F8C6C6D|nr:hypothetical protein [Pseudoflavitalea rhizosphaerae]